MQGMVVLKYVLNRDQFWCVLKYVISNGNTGVQFELCVKRPVLGLGLKHLLNRGQC